MPRSEERGGMAAVASVGKSPLGLQKPHPEGRGYLLLSGQDLLTNVTQCGSDSAYREIGIGEGGKQWSHVPEPQLNRS